MASYYQRVPPPKGLGGGYVALLDAMDAYEARALTAANATERAALMGKRELVRELLNWMWREYDALGTSASIKADEIIRRRIRQTAVRPPASGRLESGVVSRPIPTTWPGGALGVADLEILEKTAINPRYHGKGKKSYWRAQEYGYAGHVGRRVVGLFEGTSPPSASEFRVHAYFEQAARNAQGKAPKGTPAMVITKPLHARHFLRDGTDELLLWRQREVSRINRVAINRLVAI
jgi:hypothetical protein